MSNKKITDSADLSESGNSVDYIFGVVGGTFGKVTPTKVMEDVSDEIGEKLSTLDNYTSAVEAAETAAATANEAAAAVSEYETRLAAVEESVANLGVTSGYYVGKWTDGDSSPDAVEFDGNPAVADLFRPAVIDHTDNSGDTMTLTMLNRLNTLRLATGEFNTHGRVISEDQWAECDVALYLDAEASEQYCAAGEFDAEKFYEEYGGETPLYDADGNSVFIRRPWDCTDTDHSIVIANTQDLWLVDQNVGTSGYQNKGLFTAGGKYDGFDFTKYKIPVTGFMMAPTTISSKFRNNYFAYSTGETNCVGGAGTNSLCTAFYQNGTYPRISDVTQITTKTYARNNNSDTTASYPFAEGGDLWLNAFISAIELKAGTKNLITTTMFGSGISSDDSDSSETTWKADGGIRYKASSASSWTYCGWSSTAKIYTDTSATTKTATTLINGEYPKSQCCEGIYHFSLLQELGYGEDEQFTDDEGNVWWWESVSGIDSVAEGHMNARLYKLMTTTISAYDADGEACDYDVEIILRFSLFEGLELSGDVFAYVGGGLELVGTGVGSTSASSQQVDVFIEPDQTAWHSVTSASTTSTFSFEDTYTKIGTQTVVGDHWAKDRVSYAPWSPTSGGGSTTYECFYNLQKPYWDSVAGTRYRIGARRRGTANSSYCSPRCAYCTYAVSYGAVSFAGSAQVLGTWAQ